MKKRDLQHRLTCAGIQAFICLSIEGIPEDAKKELTTLWQMIERTSDLVKAEPCRWNQDVELLPEEEGQKS